MSKLIKEKPVEEVIDTVEEAVEEVAETAEEAPKRKTGNHLKRFTYTDLEAGNTDLLEVFENQIIRSLGEDFLYSDNGLNLLAAKLKERVAIKAEQVKAEKLESIKRWMKENNIDPAMLK